MFPTQAQPKRSDITHIQGVQVKKASNLLITVLTNKMMYLSDNVLEKCEKNKHKLIYTAVHILPDSYVIFT